MSTTDAFTIRLATAADAPAVREIRNAAIRGSLAIWTSREQDAQEASAWLEPLVSRGTALVATTGTGDQVVGFAVAGPWHPYEGYARTVEDSLYLAPQAQGQGLGGRLLQALLSASRAAGDRTVVAQIEASHAQSVRLHTRAGFSVVGTMEAAGEKAGQVLDLTIMSLRL